MDTTIFPTLVILVCIDVILVTKALVTEDAHLNSSKPTCTQEASPCKEGILIPMWYPHLNLNDNDKTYRASLYMLGLIYMFLGVSIVSDRFVTAIEAITSKEKEVVVKVEDGATTIVREKVWNETVANLTLMALGSSAPEIMLSIIEICGNNFRAGDLGPSTIVGSAAYNLFVITAICVYVVPSNESRTINQLNVFFVTSACSIFAYVWLYIILLVFSEGVVEIWEGVLTFLFFPGTVLIAYIVDTGMLNFKSLRKTNINNTGVTEVIVGKKKAMEKGQYLSTIDQQRQDAIETIRELRECCSNFELTTLTGIGDANDYSLHKTKSYYRNMARIKQRKNVIKVPAVKNDHLVTTIFFSNDKYRVVEDVGVFKVAVNREGGDTEQKCHVDYQTVDGTATNGRDYISTSGTLDFMPNEKKQLIEITIIDDDFFEPQEFFHLELSNARFSDSTIPNAENAIKLGTCFKTTITIIDNDHPGIFQFSSQRTTVPESIGTIYVTVSRTIGGKGNVKIPYHVVDGSADSISIYEVLGKELMFKHDEFEKSIHVLIKNNEKYKKKEQFTLVLDQPIDVDAVDGHDISRSNSPKLADVVPILGENTTYCVTIKECDNLRKAVDMLMKTSFEKTHWNQQFLQAITVFTGYDPSENDIRLPSFCDYISHFTMLSWKLVGAVVPPPRLGLPPQGANIDTFYDEDYIGCLCLPDYYNGWACFFVSLLLIAILTAIIGDLASGFGCTVGLKDALTAISFVALGTSLPDTFASKMAAIGERYADSAIGNVTGSNAVNVFMGLGIAWTLAAIMLHLRGEKFVVPPGDLATSVAVYCVLSFVATGVLLARRSSYVGGELGGPFWIKVFTSLFLMLLWFIYLLISTLVMYCYITPV